MQRYEYKVIATPRKLKRVRGVKGPQARFAHILTETMNEYAVDGWEYLRAESLPVDESQGLFKGSIETFQSVLVFRRALDLEAGSAPVIAPLAEEPIVEQAEDEAPKVEDIAPSQLEEPEPEHVEVLEEAADPLVEMAEGARKE